jgi:hypothetical protein
MGGQSERLKAFVKLGTFLREFVSWQRGPTSGEAPDPWLIRFKEATVLAGRHNAWFTEQNILQALASWGDQLKEEHLRAWLSGYDTGKNRVKTVAVVMAGNIPLVGFHDFLSVLLTGNKVQVKCSSNDRVLLPAVAQYLASASPEIGRAVTFQENRLEHYDAVIATGTDNSSRYFEYYFGRKPHIIRKNRNAVAILDGGESGDELFALGKDIFSYFGLGCRNVSKLYVPKNYNFETFFKAMEPYTSISLHPKYANNYDYNKAVYLMSEFPFLDNGFLLLKEDKAYSSPIGVLFYEYYDHPKTLQALLKGDTDKIQCVVGTSKRPGVIAFGKAQEPALRDYADGVDTVEFLLRT